MKAILFDCRDKGLGCTLRVTCDQGHTLLQGQMYGESPMAIAERIAAGLQADLVYRGPPETIRGNGEIQVHVSETAAADLPVEVAVAETEQISEHQERQSGDKSPHSKGKVVLTPRYLFE